MKVLIKFSGRIETVENVSVDDKCFPVVAGLHPYPTTTGDISPLVRESALWFKTLAVEAVYIDCDRKWIYWAPIVSSTSSGDVLLRRASTEPSVSNDFIPASAKPLFKDSSVYDFDASLKEMMGKCTEAARKLFKKFQSTDEFQKIIAKILHLYILPSINFTEDDLFSLKRAQCLVELRLGRSENEIANKANTIANLQHCLDTLKSNILAIENLDSEKYLRTCKKEFLEAFLKTVESNITDLNNELSAQQSKVNWAKQHPDETYRLNELQEKRDSVFHEIDKLIRVREAIRNVLYRRDLTGRKKQKCVVVTSCFHNVFVEVVRRLELEELSLGKLGNDKVNICAAREAIVCTVLELVSDSNRSSDRATKFEPEDFTDYSVNEGQNGEKSAVWLTFQERVTRVLKDASSTASRLHKDGCQNLTLKINAALSEYCLTTRKESKLSQDHDVGSVKSSLNVSDVRLRNSKAGNNHSKNRSAVLIDREYQSSSMYSQRQTMDTSQAQAVQSATASSASDKNADLLTRKALSTNDINLHLPESNPKPSFICFDDNRNKSTLRPPSDSFVIVDEHFATEIEESSFEFVDDVGFKRGPLTRQRKVMTAQLALSALMSMVDGLKLQIVGHFGDVIACLGEVINWEEGQASELEQQELLWKSYDRFFCQEVYEHLLKLYKTGLTLPIRKTYITLRKTSLLEILKDDKLLDLFFGETIMIDRASFYPPSVLANDELPFTKSGTGISLDVRCCDIKDLYTLANADAMSLQEKLSLDGMKCEEEVTHTSSSDSQKSSDLSSDDEDFPVANSATSSTSVISVPSSDGLTREDFNELDKWKTLSNADKVEEVLDPVLSPFKKLIQKCLDATCFLDKIRYITKATEGLNRDISQMIGPDFKSACDDIISMLILALYNLSEEMFVGLYVNLRMILDVLPVFLDGTLWDYNLVTLCASYDYLFTLKTCELVVKDYPGSFRIRK